MLADQVTTVVFTVHGKPQQRGSKQASLIPKRGGGFVTNKSGRPLVVARDMNANSKEWMGQVRDAAVAVFKGDLIRGPVSLTVRFYFKRIKGHYRTGTKSHLLRDDAPTYHTSTPDLAKLIRALEDSLTGVVYADDKQIAEYGTGTGKFWTTQSERAEVVITLLHHAHEVL